MSGDGPSLSIEPPIERWPDLARRWWAPDDATRAASRGALSLPTDRPIVMTGHQAEVWHPGILAKFLAADAAATDARAAWLIADQDDNDATTLTIPVRDARGVLVRERLSLGAAAGPTRPTGAMGPIRAEPTTRNRPALESVARGIDAIGRALDDASGEGTLARQFAAALTSLASAWLRPAPTIFATELHRTPAFAELIDRMRADPAGAVEAYNRAAGESLEAGVGPLERTAGRIELPLWRIRPEEARTRVYAHELDGIDPGELAPRALLMTAIVRMALCDLFIHGTGGAAYDRVTERWIGAWLGRPLAPAVLATADVLLPLHEAEVTRGDVAAASWRAHRARHDPSLVGEPSLAARKDALVGAIAAAPRSSRQRAERFRDMHEMLASYRTDRREELRRLDRQAGRARQALASREVARDRTWPFPLHDAGAMRALRDAIDATLGAEGVCCP